MAFKSWFGGKQVRGRASEVEVGSRRFDRGVGMSESIVCARCKAVEHGVVSGCVSAGIARRLQGQLTFSGT